MSDEEVQTKAPAKRGRKPNPEKVAAKKDAVVATKAKNGDDNDAPPSKRGRGRPKGSGVKKAAASKTNGATAKPAAKGRPRRSKKEEKEESSAEEEDEKSSANEEEEDDE